MTKNCFVYMMSNNKHGVIYIGVTSDLERRVFKHKNGSYDGFTSKYKLYNLVYFEQTNDIKVAIAREKQLKKLEKRLENRFDRKRKSRVG